MDQSPDLKIPFSSVSVKIRIIDTTTRVGDIPSELFMSPIFEGLEHLNCPAYSFLIEHPSNGKLLFDLGARKDYMNLPPLVSNRIRDGGWKVEVQKGVREQLEEHGIDGKDIDAVIWSHWHWDHIGDMSTFDKRTTLVVGPGFKQNFIPAYPTNPDSPLLESDFEGRVLREISFDTANGLQIGGFNAFDYFGDGSFFLLDSPGHAIGHMCALARVTSDSFVFMGGDACHHGGQFRPSRYLGLPSVLLPNPFENQGTLGYPGALFDHLLPDGDRNKPFFTVSSSTNGNGVATDANQAGETIRKIQEVDANDKILVVMAHDASLLDVLDFFPRYVDGFVQKGWVKAGRWVFLKDFKKALKEQL
ncbi:Metallo-hydrolase/oxidoreductase [Trichoderma sp. SZMC 28011]